MYHPGGFGGSNNNPFRSFKRSEPSLLKPIICLLGVLSGWTGCLLLGLHFGFGWYAWPLGSIVLGVCFFSGSLVFHTRRKSRKSLS